MSELIEHQACPCGKSSDALAVYDDGHSHCFSCDKTFQGDVTPGAAKASTKIAPECVDPTTISIGSLPRRGLVEATCRKFGYGKATVGGKTVQIAPYYDEDGNLVAQKIRGADKAFSVRGDLKAATLFGQQLWRTGGRRIVVTEGELDALSVAQVTGLTWPVVSVPNGAGGARKAVQRSLDFLSSYEQVVFLFDNDEPGRKAAIECAEMLPPGKAYIASCAPYKDASDMLQADAAKALNSATWEGKRFAPDGIIPASAARDKAVSLPARGISWPWPALTEATFGICLKECYAFGAGTGVGKSDMMAEVVKHLIYEHDEACGVLFLEQSPEDTLRRIAGKVIDKPLHVPDGTWTQPELESAVDDLVGRDKLFLYDHFGVMEWETVISRIRYMVTSGVKYIFLDHLTALAAQEDDERRALEAIMSVLGGMVQELNFTLFFVSHLATPEGKSHEEGGRVAVRHFKGSRAIGFWSTHMFGLERNQQAEDRDEQSTTTLRVLKDRRTGRATGVTISLRYDYATGRLHECADTSLDASEGY